MEQRLAGKVAIVTGAGRLRGIGRAAALAFAKLGADVVITGTGRNPDNFPPDEKSAGWKDIDSTAEQIRTEGRRALPLIVDVTKPEDVTMMLNKTIEEFGGVDILVNNAAFARVPGIAPILELEQHIFQKVIDVKLVGTYLCSKAVIGHMLARGKGGKIVNISSIAGKTGGATSLSYNSACLALVGMTQSMAQELGPYGINVNCVCPGAVDTSRVDDLGRGEKWLDAISNIPIGRAGTDDEVGGFIAYLCTNQASWIHGQSINMDGGQMMIH